MTKLLCNYDLGGEGYCLLCKKTKDRHRTQIAVRQEDSLKYGILTLMTLRVQQQTSDVPKICQALDNGMSACGVFIDLQKPFDT